jgi:DnaJ-class molecular chaperone
MKFHWAFTLLTAFLIVNAGSPSYYNILGLKDNASLDDVKTAFRKLSTRFHPDKSPDDYEKYLQIINAYEVIT